MFKFQLQVTDNHVLPNVIYRSEKRGGGVIFLKKKVLSHWLCNMQIFKKEKKTNTFTDIILFDLFDFNIRLVNWLTEIYPWLIRSTGCVISCRSNCFMNTNSYEWLPTWRFRSTVCPGSMVCPTKIGYGDQRPYLKMCWPYLWFLFLIEYVNCLEHSV